LLQCLGGGSDQKPNMQSDRECQRCTLHPLDCKKY
jgi:hypothetical protein